MLTIELKAAFLFLACGLSPENLYADGERTHAQAQDRAKALRAEWHALEQKIGFSVGEDEAFHFHREVTAHEQAQRQKAVDALPSHPLVRKGPNPGAWFRDGTDSRTAYYVWGAPHHGPGYTLYSEFAYLMRQPEKIGVYPTLDAAVEAGEAFLKTVTFESFKAANPLYRDEIVHRELKRLPV